MHFQLFSDRDLTDIYIWQFSDRIMTHLWLISDRFLQLTVLWQISDRYLTVFCNFLYLHWWQVPNSRHAWSHWSGRGSRLRLPRKWGFVRSPLSQHRQRESVHGCLAILVVCLSPPSPSSLCLPVQCRKPPQNAECKQCVTQAGRQAGRQSVSQPLLGSVHLRCPKDRVEQRKGARLSDIRLRIFGFDILAVHRLVK